MRWTDKKKVKNKIEKCVVIYVTLIGRSRLIDDVEHNRICFPHPNFVSNTSMYDQLSHFPLKSLTEIADDC